MEHGSSAGGVGGSCPRATPQVCPVATSTEGREAPATTSARSDTAGPWAPAAPQWSSRCQPQAPKTGIRAPHPEEKVAGGTRARFQVGGGTQSGRGRRRHSSEPPRSVEESPPTSSASVNARQGCTMRDSWNGPGRGSCQRVVVASPDRVDTVECRGRRRGATVGDTVEPSWSAPSLQLLQSTCPQRCRGCVLQWNSCRRRRKMSVSKPTRNPRRCVVGKISFHNATRRLQEWIQGRQRDLQAAIVAGRFSEVARISQLLSSEHRNGNGSSKNNLQRCHLQWRIW